MQSPHKQATLALDDQHRQQSYLTCQDVQDSVSPDDLQHSVSWSEEVEKEGHQTQANAKKGQRYDAVHYGDDLDGDTVD